MVDELDDLKKYNDKRVRPRARQTLSLIDQTLHDGRERGVLVEATEGRREVTLEIVFDPPGHVRLPINDDEIIDRVMAIQQFLTREFSPTTRRVTLLTYDTGQSTRARAAGVTVMKLGHQVDEEAVPKS